MEKGLVDNFEGLTGTIGIALTYAALIGYVVLLAPNQTPFRDQLFIMKSVNMDVDVVLNPVFYAVFFGMGVFPWIFLSLLIPSAKSRNGVPFWPFFLASNFVGAFALLPYFAVWNGTPRDVKCPPAQEDLEGLQNSLLKVTESKITPFVLLSACLYLVGQAALGGPQALFYYLKLFDESKVGAVYIYIFFVSVFTIIFYVSLWIVVNTGGYSVRQQQSCQKKKNKKKKKKKNGKAHV
eukprot:TRINITY_DN5555_c0_g1_i6.p2 TRINITY_DN5555_c0_g1~~TRINITY_DN5555_c0_g1_i6.p2  ORF type:complete len:248 (+),score=33.86 TRINITY_DN5555_c0_g1_i6:34-744(+)